MPNMILTLLLPSVVCLGSCFSVVVILATDPLVAVAAMAVPVIVASLVMPGIVVALAMVAPVVGSAREPSVIAAAMSVPVLVSSAMAVLGGVVALVAMALFFIVVIAILMPIIVTPVIVTVTELSVLVMVLPLVDAPNCSGFVVITAMEPLDVLLPFFIDRFNGFIVNTLLTPS
jgi:hypothetical protein